MSYLRQTKQSKIYGDVNTMTSLLVWWSHKDQKKMREAFGEPHNWKADFDYKILSNFTETGLKISETEAH